MVRIKVRLSSKGQLVIPKKIREALGLAENSFVLLEVKEKTIEIKPTSGEDIVKSWKEIAKKHAIPAKKMIYGDKLYEEEFG